MLVTTKGRYALRMMLNIASYGTDRKIALRQVAEEEDISLKYLEQLAHTMVEAGFLTSARGHGGGYALARPASKIGIGEVLRTAEDGITAVDREDSNSTNAKKMGKFWDGLTNIIDEYLDKKSLADLTTLRKGAAAE